MTRKPATNRLRLLLGVVCVLTLPVAVDVVMCCMGGVAAVIAWSAAVVVLRCGGGR
jgi:hypothetical protein